MLFMHVDGLRCVDWRIKEILLHVVFGQGGEEKSIVGEDRKYIEKYPFLMDSTYNFSTSLLQRIDKIGDQNVGDPKLGLLSFQRCHLLPKPGTSYLISLSLGFCVCKMMVIKFKSKNHLEG